MIGSTRKVRKRDGREVPFDQGKICDAIFRAARSVGGGDRFLAEELGSVVALFIDREWADRTPSIDDVSDLIEKVLVETGHAGTAKSFILERDRRDRIRSTLRVRRDDQAGPEAGAPTVDARAHATVSAWSKGKIIESLVVEAELAVQVSEEIAGEVERRVFSSGLTRVSTSLIRALVENELFERGHEGVLSRQLTIGLPRYDLDRLARGGIEGDPQPGCADALDRNVAAPSWTQYSLLSVYPTEVVDGHCCGLLHLGGLASPTRFQALEVDLSEPNAGFAGGASGFHELRLFLCRAAELSDERVVLRGLEHRILESLLDVGCDLQELARMLLLAVGSPGELPVARPRARLVFPLLPRRAWLDQVLASGGDARVTRQRYRQWLGALLQQSALLPQRQNPVRVPELVLDVGGVDRAEAEDMALLEQTVLAEGTGRVLALIEPGVGGVLGSVAPLLLRVDLNLARAAFRARRFETASVLSQAEAAASLAVTACEARARFLRGLPGQSSPRERLKRLFPGEPGVLTAGRYEIGLAGLGAACRIAFDHEPLADERSREFATALVAGLRKFIAAEARRVRLPLTCAFCDEEAVLSRFGKLDLERHPRGREVHDVPLDGKMYIYQRNLGDMDAACDPTEIAAIEEGLRRELPAQPLPSYHSQAVDRIRFLRHYSGLIGGSNSACI
ncbi:MAG: ATP cone domain-containing protein [Planctomycetota bacterium]